MINNNMIGHKKTNPFFASLKTACKVFRDQGTKAVFGFVILKTGKFLCKLSERSISISERLYKVPSAFECPICGLRMNEWSRFHRKITKDTYRIERPCLCPRCRSFERHRAMWLYFQKTGLLRQTPPPRMLHFAPERCFEVKLRSVLGQNYTTTDLNMPDVDVRCDITSLDLKNDQFDFIYCSNVLEHIPDDMAAMREIYRVMSSTGLAIIQVPLKGDKTLEDPRIVTPEERDKHYGQSDHVRMYGKDIKERLESVGFFVHEVEMPEALDLGNALVERYNIAKRETYHFCRKTLQGA